MSFVIDYGSYGTINNDISNFVDNIGNNLGNIPSSTTKPVVPSVPFQNKDGYIIRFIFKIEKAYGISDDNTGIRPYMKKITGLTVHFRCARNTYTKLKIFGMDNNTDDDPETNGTYIIPNDKKEKEYVEVDYITYNTTYYSVADRL